MDVLYMLMLLLTSPIWVWRLLRTGKWRTDWRSRFGHVALKPRSANDRRPTLLVHAVSVGEVNAIAPLVTALDAAVEGRWRIVVSSTTDTGIARAQELFASRHDVVRYPFDFSWMVRRFLKRVSPDVVALTELEVWPNFVKACEKRHITTCVINGRLSARSFKRYKLLASLLRPTFGRLAAAAVQTEDYAQRFMYLGVRDHRIAVTDSMKWDKADFVDDVPGADALARAMGIDRARPVVVAGSIAPGEDKLLIDSIPAHVQLVLVPRKPEWFEGVVKIAPGIVRRSEHGDDQPPRPFDGQRLFLLDTMGELRKAYALADVCVVGRSFLGLYGSDMIEPASLGKPVVIGPCHSDFADIMMALTDAQAIVVTDRPGPAVKELLENEAMSRQLAARGKAVIRQRQGSTARHVDLLTKLMYQRFH